MTRQETRQTTPRRRTRQILANFEARSVLLFAAWTLGSGGAMAQTPASLGSARQLARQVVQMSRDTGDTAPRPDLMDERRAALPCGSTEAPPT